MVNNGVAFIEALSLTSAGGTIFISNQYILEYLRLLCVEAMTSLLFSVNIQWCIVVTTSILEATVWVKTSRTLYKQCIICDVYLKSVTHEEDDDDDHDHDGKKQ